MAFAVHAVLKVINLLMYIAMLHADTPTATAPPSPVVRNVNSDFKGVVRNVIQSLMSSAEVTRCQRRFQEIPLIEAARRWFRSTGL